jgi:hypothetical protein
MKIHKTEKAMLKQQAKDNRKNLEMYVEDADISTLTADGFDAAIIGVTDSGEVRVVYDYETCVRVLMADGMSEEDAIEHMSFNVMGSHVGEQTPIFIRTL